MDQQGRNSICGSLSAPLYFYGPEWHKLSVYNKALWQCCDPFIATQSKIQLYKKNNYIVKTITITQVACMIESGKYIILLEH